MTSSSRIQEATQAVNEAARAEGWLVATRPRRTWLSAAAIRRTNPAPVDADLASVPGRAATTTSVPTVNRATVKTIPRPIQGGTANTKGSSPRPSSSPAALIR